MNKIEKLKRALKSQLPRVEIALDPAAKPTGTSYLDARLGKHAVVIEWRPAVGFGISSNPTGEYGDKPDEFYEDVDSACERAVEILRTGQHTRPIDPVALRRLREARGISQVELADLMGIRQATVSKMEHRRDLNLSTLRRLVHALGGTLEVKARFPGRTLTIEVPATDDSR